MPDSVPLVFGEGDQPISDREYRLLEKLGSGGFGQVWKASGEGTDVALKIVHLAGLEEARRELWALARLGKVRHANLVPVTAAYVIDHIRHRLAPEEWDSDRAGALIIVMTLCEKSLEKRLRECRKEGLPGIPLEELLNLMQGAARGLDYLHRPSPSQGREQAIVHCDIKPLNILITGGEPQICDFGLARVFDTGDTKYTTQIGSIAYMSPEVLLEGKAAIPASDQYALAISYVELRTGRLPFGSGEGVTLSDVTSTLINNRHKLDELEDAERSVIQRAVTLDPHKRFENCVAMVEALKAATSERPKGKSSGLFGRLFGRSEEAGVPHSSAEARPTLDAKAPLEQQREGAKPAGTMVAPEFPTREQETAAVADSARQSTAPPTMEFDETAPLVSDEDRESRAESAADAARGKPRSAQPRPKSRGRRSILSVATAIALLVAILAGIDHFADLGGMRQVMRFGGFASEEAPQPAPLKSEPPLEPRPPEPEPPVEPQPPEPEPPVEPRPPEPTVDPAEKARQDWEARVSKLLKAKDFAGVCASWQVPPAGVKKDDPKPLYEEVRNAWRNELRQRLDDGEFADAAKLLDDELSLVADPAAAPRDWTSTFDELLGKPNFEGVMRLVDEFDPGLVGESRQQYLTKAQPLWQEEFNKLLHPGAFSEANGFLEKYPPKQFGENLDALRTQLRSGWLGHIRDIWSADPQRPEAKGALKECDALLAQFSDSAEARLIKARALVEQEKATPGESELQAVKESDLPQERRHLHRALTTIVMGERADVDRDQIRDRLIELDANPIPDDADPFAKLTKVEIGWLNRHRRETVDSLLTRIDGYVDSEKFDDARSELQSAANLTRDEKQRGELGYRRAIVDLGDPQATREQLVDALVEAKQLMQSRDRAEVERLASAAGTLGQRSPPTVDLALLDDAVGLLRGACDRFKIGEELPQRFGELLSRRAELRIADPTLPTEDELIQLQNDWNRATKARVEIPVVDAWRAECLVALGKVEDADGLLPSIAGRVSEDAAFAAYEAYVRALAYNASDRRQAGKILEALDETFKTAEAKEGILAKQNRLPTAARMILDATHQQLPIPGKGKKATEAYLWDTPFASPDDAGRHLRLLSQVEEILADETGGTDPNEQRAQQRRRLEVGLMLAALHHSPPQLDLAWSHASKLAKIPDSQLGADTLPVLASCVRTHLLLADREGVEPADHQIAIASCTRIVGLFQDAAITLDDVDAVTFYQSVLAPVLAIAAPYAEGMSETTEHAIDPAVLEDFYAAVGRLIWKRKFTQWPFATTSESVAEETARLFGWAIHIHRLRHGDKPTKEAAAYYLTCGHATLATHKPDLDLVQKYADKVLEIRPDSHGANGLLSNIHLTRSRQQLTRADHLRLLDDAIEVGNLAVENSPQDDPGLVNWLLNLGTAYVERANFTRDLFFDTQKEDLDRAIESAKLAVKLENTNPDYPYLILGNAYEDLAWLVRHDVEANYQEAIKSFWMAADNQKLFRAQAMYGVGRCYYKVVVDSHLDPSQWRLRNLDRPSGEEMLQQAAAYLVDATGTDPSLADAFFFLGLVKLNQGDPGGADANFLLAKDAALEKALPSAGIYALQWALMAGPHDETGLDTIQSRVEVLENATGSLANVLHASARKAKVQSLNNAKQYAEALGVIGQAGPDDRSEMDSRHVPLLQQRVRCRNGLLPDNWNWETAQETLSDAERALELSYTRADLSESLYLTATMRGAIAERTSRLRAEAENGPPADLQGTETSQLSRGIADIRQAVELVPHLEAPTASSRRFLGALLVWQEMRLIREKELELSPEEAKSFVGELRQGIQWADEFLRIPKTAATDKTYCEQMKTAFEQELNARSQP